MEFHGARTPTRTGDEEGAGTRTATKMRDNVDHVAGVEDYQLALAHLPRRLPTLA
jgi:hypothetical protein